MIGISLSSALAVGAASIADKGFESESRVPTFSAQTMVNLSGAVLQVQPKTAGIFRALTGDNLAVAERINPPTMIAPVAEITTSLETTPTLKTQPVPEIPHYLTWLALAQCESNNEWSIRSGSGFYGGLQFTLQSWRNVNGLNYAERPDLATPAEQMLTAENLLDVQGWGTWPGCARKLGLR